MWIGGAMIDKVFIAANNGAIGGGEVMLLNIAHVLRNLGYSVSIIAPAQPNELIEAAKDEGFTTVTFPNKKRSDYMILLRRWRIKNKIGLLWCNGLLPAVATAGTKNRIVHLHKMPTSKQKLLLSLARQGSNETLVPSKYLASHIPNSKILHNWVNEVSAPRHRKLNNPFVRVGFLGRPSPHKGTDVLAEAVHILNTSNTSKYRLILGGTPKFVGDRSQKKVGVAIDRLGSSVEVLGWVSAESFMEKIDMLVVPSVREEAFGLVAVEAMSARVPLIVSDTGALREVVGEDYPWICEPGNPDDLARVIHEYQSLLVRNPEAAQKIINDAYWRWHDNFSPRIGKANVADLMLLMRKQV